MSEQFPDSCTKCMKRFKPGDKFFYDMLDDDPSLDDLCEVCAKDITMMASGVIPNDTHGANGDEKGDDETMSELSEYKMRLDESSARIASAAGAKIHAECNRQIAELEHRLAAAEARTTFVPSPERWSEVQSQLAAYKERAVVQDGELAKLTRERDAIQAKLAASEALLREAVEALQALYDYQNGCPLPTYRVGWTAAMVAAENVLRDADERLEKQIAAKEVAG